MKTKRDAYIARLNGIYAANLKKENVEHVAGWGRFVDAKTIRVAVGGGGAPSRPLLTMRAGRRRSLRGQEHSHRNGWRADGACRSRFAVARAPASSRVERRAPGAELGITSDGFFELTELPPRTIVVGAGYIAVELAGILQVVSSSIERVGGF